MASVQTRCSWMMVVLFWNYCCPFISAIAETARLPLRNDAHCRQHSYTIPMPSYLSTAFQHRFFAFFVFLLPGFILSYIFVRYRRCWFTNLIARKKEQGENRMNILVSPEFRIRTSPVLDTIYCCRVSECNVVSGLRLNKMLKLICLPLLHLYIRQRKWMKTREVSGSRVVQCIRLFAVYNMVSVFFSPFRRMQ